MDKKKPIFIAEIKTQSPFGFESLHSWDELFDMANRYGDWISVHTNPLWGGSWKLLAEARKRTKKPILAKGIHGSDESVAMAFNTGADYVLSVGRIPEKVDWMRDGEFDLDKILIEPISFAQYLSWDRFNHSALQKLVFNQRDLSNGKAKDEDYDMWRKVTPWLCQASRIRNINEVRPDANAFIVGSNLPFFINSLKKN